VGRPKTGGFSEPEAPRAAAYRKEGAWYTETMGEPGRGGAMTQEKPSSGLSEEMLKEIAAYKQEKRARKEEWLTYHKERHPVFAPTNEEGTFAGLVGFGTTVGARIFPYYRTESGVYFYEHEDPRSEENPSRREKKVIQLDLEEIRRKGVAKLYTPESFLENPKGELEIARKRLKEVKIKEGS
jgi:hypothetical protein